MRQAAIKKTKGDRRGMETTSSSLVRASISFPPDLYEMLEKLAKQKKVSLAWVVRDAAEQYLSAKSPLSGKQA